MTSIDQLHHLGDLGVQFAGMIFYPKSPRCILPKLRGDQVKNEKFKVFKIGVFVNAEVKDVLKQVDAYGLDMVQLHGNETPYFCEQIANYISVIKAFRITENDSVQWKVKGFFNDTDMYMFDTEGEGYGGTGKKFNWDKLIEAQDVKKPFFLSGGIEPTDAPAIVDFAKQYVAKDLFALDINSRFEIAPGIKDMSKVETFVKEIEAGISIT